MMSKMLMYTEIVVDDNLAVVSILNTCTLRGGEGEVQSNKLQTVKLTKVKEMV